MDQAEILETEHMGKFSGLSLTIYASQSSSSDSPTKKIRPGMKIVGKKCIQLNDENKLSLSTQLYIKCLSLSSMSIGQVQQKYI